MPSDKAFQGLEPAHHLFLQIHQWSIPTLKPYKLWSTWNKRSIENVLLPFKIQYFDYLCTIKSGAVQWSVSVIISWKEFFDFQISGLLLTHKSSKIKKSWSQHSVQQFSLSKGELSWFFRINNSFNSPRLPCHTSLILHSYLPQAANCRRASGFVPAKWSVHYIRVIIILTLCCNWKSCKKNKKGLIQI